MILCASLAVSASAVKFKDVPSNHWAHSAIQLAATRGVVSGYIDGTFLPSANVTNAQFVVMLSRSFYAWGIYENTPGQPWWWPNWFALDNNGIFRTMKNSVIWRYSRQTPEMTSHAMTWPCSYPVFWITVRRQTTKSARSRRKSPIMIVFLNNTERR